MQSPRISIVVPIHKTMKHGDFFFWRLIQSIMSQTFKDYEIVIVQEGLMAENTNAGIQKSKGELIKILYMDDYFAHENALKNISDHFEDGDQWLVTGCLHQQSDPENYEDPHSPHYPHYTEDIVHGNNRIGSPSVLTIRNKGRLLFDDSLSFLLDCDLYHRYFSTYGPPKMLNDLNIVIGIGDHQVSATMPTEDKLKEFEYMRNKYD